MSAYAKTWLIQGAALLALLMGALANSWWLFVTTVALVVIAMVWPRCDACRLPTFWQKSSSAPDHFIYYLGKPLNPLPPRECSRCGADLTTPGT